MATRRRTDGMSEDGLSYSVATDFDKQLGQALEELEARTKERPQSGITISDQISDKSDSQRYIPFGPSPDRPDILRAQLLDPIMQAQAIYQGDAIRGRASSKLPQDQYRNVGGNLLKIGQGGIENVFPAKAPEMTRRQQMEYNDLLARRRNLQSGELGNTLNADAIRAIDEQIGGYFQSGASPSAGRMTPPADLIESSGFIGSPGGPNQFVAPRRPEVVPAMETPSRPTVNPERARLESLLKTPNLDPVTAKNITDTIAELDSRPAAGEELIRVINPDGKLVRIRKSDFGKTPGYRLP